MKLTLNQLHMLTVGAIQIFEDDAGVHFRRFTERQIDVIFKDDPRERNYDTTGIRIDFHTDASRICVTTGSKGKYEVLVNNLTTYCERLETPGQFEISLKGSENRITILLPSHCEGIIESISLDNATYVRKAEHPIKLAFYGDSITQGWNSEKDSQSYAWLISRYFDADSRIYGIGGTIFIPEFPEDNGFRPDAVIVAMGTNDYGRGRTMEQIKSDCTAYLDNVAKANPGSKLFCVTPIWRLIGLNVRAAGTLEDVRREIAQIAANCGYIVVDGLSMVPHLLEYYADKGTHPNDLGFSSFALNLIKELSKHL